MGRREIERAAELRNIGGTCPAPDRLEDCVYQQARTEEIQQRNVGPEAARDAKQVAARPEAEDEGGNGRGEQRLGQPPDGNAEAVRDALAGTEIGRRVVEQARGPQVEARPAGEEREGDRDHSGTHGDAGSRQGVSRPRGAHHGLRRVHRDHARRRGRDTRRYSFVELGLFRGADRTRRRDQRRSTFSRSSTGEGQRSLWRE